MSKKEKTLPIGAAVGIAVVALVIGAGGGYAIGKNSTATPTLGGDNADRQAMFDRMREGGGAGFRPGMREQVDGETVPGGRFADGMSMVSGEITSVDDNTITIGMEDETSKTVVLTSKTVISEMSQLTPEDLVVGENIFVTAESDESGALVATMLQVRPEDMAGGFMRGGMAPPQVQE